MRQREAAFFFGTRADMILRARGNMTLADRESQLNNALQGDHFPPTVVGHPPAIATLWTDLLKRPQTHSELCFGFGGSPGHRFPPCAQQRPALPLERTPAVKWSLPFSKKLRR